MGTARLKAEGINIDMATKKRKRDTSLEDGFDAALQAEGITGYERNKSFIPGRRFAADFWFPALRLAIEVDGGLWLGARGGHTSGDGAHRDRERDILAYLSNGILTFRVGTNHLGDGNALEWVKKIIDRRKDELGVR